ncbi:MAG: hypothetical protein MJ194_07825 [Clostridia bacterium]|nr:hypothetical protein [Clostridia bacterium]
MKKKTVLFLVAVALVLAGAWLVYSRPMTLPKLYPMLSEDKCTGADGCYEMDDQQSLPEFSFDKGSEGYEALWKLLDGRKFRRRLKDLIPGTMRVHTMSPGDFRWEVSFLFSNVKLEDGTLVSGRLRLESWYGELTIYFNGEAYLCRTDDQDRFLKEVFNVISLYAEKDMKDYAEEAAKLRGSIDSAQSGEELSSFGQWEPDREMMNALETQTKALTDAGYDLGYIMIDTNSGNGVAFNADQIFCSQSTIKGPYVASMYEVHPDSFNDKNDKIHDVLQYSDNDAYLYLRQTYLSDGLKNWIKTTGIRSELGNSLYVNYSAREFAKLWTEMYRFFHTSDNQELCDLYVGSKFSVCYNELGDEYTVRSKAGWEDGCYGGSKPLPEFVDKNPENDEVATNDGALIYSDNGEYIFVILSDVPADYKALQPLVRAVDDLHKTM